MNFLERFKSKAYKLKNLTPGFIFKFNDASTKFGDAELYVSYKTAHPTTLTITFANDIYEKGDKFYFTTNKNVAAYNSLVEEDVTILDYIFLSDKYPKEYYEVEIVDGKEYCSGDVFIRKDRYCLIEGFNSKRAYCRELGLSSGFPSLNLFGLISKDLPLLTFHYRKGFKEFKKKGGTLTYDYECPNCGIFEEMFCSYEDVTILCPNCQQPSKRLINNISGLEFKGSGFYETDYKKKGN